MLGLDTATVELAQRLGETPIEVWPESIAISFAAGSLLVHESARFIASRAAVVASSSHDLTLWLENPEEFNTNEELEPSTRHWLIYFPSAEVAPAYAELSERAARTFNFLSALRTVNEVSLAFDDLPNTEVLKVLDGLAELGVIVSDRDCLNSEVNPALLHYGIRDKEQCSAPSCGEPTAWQSQLISQVSSTLQLSSMGTLPDDAFVMLDPTVEVVGDKIDKPRLLCNSHLEVGIAIPLGEGLLEFLSAMMGKPVRVGTLRAGFDNQRLLDEALASLRLHGFLYVTSQAMPSIEELAHLRHIVEQMRKKTLRCAITIDLDVPMSLEHLCDHLNTGETAPEVLLRCVRLAEHKVTLAALARLRQDGTLRLQHTAIQTTDLTCDSDVYRSLIRLGASVILEGVPWPTPDYDLPGLAEMTRNCVAVHVLVTPDLSILEKSIRDRALAWAGSVFISGLCLQLEADALWTGTDVTEEAFVAVFGAVRELEEEFGDVRIANLPSDEVLLGNTVSCSFLAQQSDFANRFRIAYLHWRLSFLKSFEGDNMWSQTPEAEEKVVRPQEDLIPNHPQLLLLRPGSIVVDVCGGLGRVARRLAQTVGQDGLIISIEMLRCLSDRARHIACERNMTNLHFRPGLAQRIPLPGGTADAAINEWTGAIWEQGLGPAMVREMARVVRSGGRIAVTHRLMRIPLTRLGQPWIQYEEIYNWMHNAFEHQELSIITERVWGQTVTSLVGENATEWRKQYVPCIVNQFNVTYEYEEHAGSHADIYLTIIAERK